MYGSNKVSNATEQQHEPPRELPPLRAAHEAMLRRLAEIKAPIIPADPSPDDIYALDDYVIDVRRAIDEWLRQVGLELQSNTTVRVDMDCFTDVLRRATDGMGCFEITRAARAISELNCERWRE